MPRYSCPKCGSAMSMADAPDGGIRISCRCGIGCTLEGSDEPNRVFLEFLRRYDAGETLEDGHADMKVRSEEEIVRMIGDADPDQAVREILYTKQDYVCHYSHTDSPGPPPGDGLEGLGMEPALEGYLRESGITRMYRFQEEAYRSVTDGKDTVIVAPTASGKTEAFLVPVVQMVAETRRPVLALIVYPTKALARDQHAKIWKMARSVKAESAVFDGDTPQDQRRRIMESPPQILVTNFDVINYHLPRRTRFASPAGLGQGSGGGRGPHVYRDIRQQRPPYNQETGPRMRPPAAGCRRLCHRTGAGQILRPAVRQGRHAGAQHA